MSRRRLSDPAVLPEPTEASPEPTRAEPERAVPLGPSPAAIEAAGADLARARATRDSLTPEKAADLAYQPGGPTREELADRIRARRAAARQGAA